MKDCTGDLVSYYHGLMAVVLLFLALQLLVFVSVLYAVFHSNRICVPDMVCGRMYLRRARQRAMMERSPPEIDETLLERGNFLQRLAIKTFNVLFQLRSSSKCIVKTLGIRLSFLPTTGFSGTSSLNASRISGNCFREQIRVLIVRAMDTLLCGLRVVGERSRTNGRSSQFVSKFQG